MSIRRLISVALLSLTFSVARAQAQIFSYECNAHPARAGWQIVQEWCDPALWVDQSWFCQHLELCPGFPPPGGQQAAYRRTIDEFQGLPTFFLEWRIETDADRSEIPWGGGGGIAAGSHGAVAYTFFIARDQAKLNRDNTLPIVFVDLEPGMAHTHRLELHNGAETMSYIWYIDGQIVDSGRPEGTYPSFSPRVTWLARSVWFSNTTKWDYIRYGAVPADHSGDFDSNGQVDDADLYFFVDCLLGPGGAWRGCNWADMDGDGVANGADVQLFVQAMIGG